MRDPDSSYRLRPEPPDESTPAHPDHVNAFGFRDREHWVCKAPGTLRSVGIGDSFVYGAVPPPHDFLRVLGERLETTLADTGWSS